jgi:hypothetical protein
MGGGFGSPQLDFKVRAIFELGRSLRLAAVIAKLRIKGIPAAAERTPCFLEAVRHDIERLRRMMTLVADGLGRRPVTATLLKARA